MMSDIIIIDMNSCVNRLVLFSLHTINNGDVESQHKEDTVLSLLPPYLTAQELFHTSLMQKLIQNYSIGPLVAPALIILCIFVLHFTQK